MTVVVVIATAPVRGTSRGLRAARRGLRDAGWDGVDATASRLAILPGRTHDDIWSAPELVPSTAALLDAEFHGG